MKKLLLLVSLWVASGIAVQASSSKMPPKPTPGDARDIHVAQKPTPSASQDSGPDVQVETHGKKAQAAPPVQR